LIVLVDAGLLEVDLLLFVLVRFLLHLGELGVGGGLRGGGVGGQRQEDGQ
jgi:hypothetical protein